LQVPGPAVEVVEEVAAGPPPKANLPRRHIEDLDVAPPIDQPEPPKERRKKKKKQSVMTEFYGNEKKAEYEVGGDGWFGSTSAGLLGGFIMLLVGIGLLVFGLVFGRLFLWSIILIVIGVIAMLKGLIDLY
jgi:hypothetical protein